MTVSLTTVVSSRVIASMAPQDVEPLAARGAADQHPHEAPEVTQERPGDEVGGVGEADDPAEPPGLPQPWP
jgi:hypothetical protein